MGCIHHCMGRHAAAAFYFTKALAAGERPRVRDGAEGRERRRPPRVRVRPPRRARVQPRAPAPVRRAARGGVPRLRHGRLACTATLAAVASVREEACAASVRGRRAAPRDRLPSRAASATDAVIGRAATRRLVLPAPTSPAAPTRPRRPTDIGRRRLPRRRRRLEGAGGRRRRRHGHVADARVRDQVPAQRAGCSSASAKRRRRRPNCSASRPRRLRCQP